MLLPQLSVCLCVDTAPNIVEYIETIYKLLKPGGVWINLGPLLYHWQSADGHEDDERYVSSCVHD